MEDRLALWSVWNTRIRSRVDPETEYKMENEEPYPEELILDDYDVDAIEGCLALSSAALTVDMLLDQLERKRTNFDKNHFYMLLRELTMRRDGKATLGYYVDWINGHLASPRISYNTRLLFSQAASSILDPEPAVHTSPLFTAYSGFLLLTISLDWRANMNTLLSEPGVTSQGIDLAGMLMGAYLGLKGLGDL